MRIRKRIAFLMIAALLAFQATPGLGTGGGLAAPATLEIAVSLAWQDDHNALKLRPKEVTLVLSRAPARDGGAGPEVVAVETFAGGGDAGPDCWQHVFAPVEPANMEGEAFVYSVAETGASPNYAQTIAGNAEAGFTVTSALRLLSLRGEAVWNPEGDIQRPKSITLELFQNKKSLQTLTVNGADAPQKDRWAYRFDGLPEYDGKGAPYQYRVAEKEVPANLAAIIGGTTVTHAMPEALAIRVRVAWSHEGALVAGQPDGVKLQLKRDGKNKGAPIPLTGEEDWTHTFALSKGDAAGHGFAVEELPLPDYQTEYGMDADGTLVITNRYRMPTVTVSGEIKWQRQDGKPLDAAMQKPTATLRLWRNNANHGEEDVPFAQTTASQAQKGYAFSGLHKYDENGVPYEYTVTQTPLTGYITFLASPATDVKGNVTADLTNVYTPEPVEWTPRIEIRVEGGGESREEYAFTLAKKSPLCPMPGNTMGKKKPLTVQGPGKSDFGPISFTAPGEYAYTVTQTRGKTPGMAYDKSVLTFTVWVTDRYGVLRVEAQCENKGQPTEAVFTNRMD